jgi:hypothetical protein
MDEKPTDPRPREDEPVPAPHPAPDDRPLEDAAADQSPNAPGPAEPMPGEPAAQPEVVEDPFADIPEAAPTDFRRNLWLLIVILGVVLLAWLLSAVVPPPEQGAAPPPGRAPQGGAGQQPPTGPAGPPPPPQQAQTGRPTLVLPYHVQGEKNGRQFVEASPPLFHNGSPIRYPRLFEVTRRADEFDMKMLYKLPGRFSDQLEPLVTAGLPPGMIVKAEQVGVLRPTDRVVTVRLGESVRVYPVRSLLHPDVLGVVDRLGETEVLVLWNRVSQTARCLLTPASEGFAWGDAGLHYGYMRLVYDKSTGALWDPLSGECLSGEPAGQRTRTLPCTVWLWKDWGARAPTSDVVLAGLDPNVHDRPEPPALVVAMGEQARVYPVSTLYGREIRTLEDTVADTPVKVFVTSPWTAYATADEKLLDAPLMVPQAVGPTYPGFSVYRVLPETPVAGAPETPLAPAPLPPH